MTTIPYRTALIVGAGSGISASVARGLATAGLKVGVAARNVDKLASLAAETGAELTRKRSAKRSRYRPSAAFWSSSRRHGG